jgi:hypothetical protein
MTVSFGKRRNKGNAGGSEPDYTSNLARSWFDVVRHDAIETLHHLPFSTRLRNAKKSEAELHGQLQSLQTQLINLPEMRQRLLNSIAKLTGEEATDGRLVRVTMPSHWKDRFWLEQTSNGLVLEYRSQMKSKKVSRLRIPLAYQPESQRVFIPFAPEHALESRTIRFLPATDRTQNEHHLVASLGIQPRGAQSPPPSDFLLGEQTDSKRGEILDMGLDMPLETLNDAVHVTREMLSVIPLLKPPDNQSSKPPISIRFQGIA